MKNVVTVAVALLVLALVLRHWKLILVTVAFGVLAYAAILAARAWWRRRAEARQKALAREELLATRAQQQHEQYLAGDDRGVYGVFTPADPDRPRQGIRRLPASPSEWRAGL
ncbi:hypothetical protein [Rhodococcus tibetensis]|uniref:Uncharacterized protein n=1 Tax=Rhodococcus tibetensis TaxID=2965064 RepID=A0ABT1QDU9_9NOCA|nr:hypothetical protein [Rhodococcus sp. FXJ9.536]MCQ4120436.1 hypothetical protein [Rhodococcus sp. FXJ9.536]